VENLGQSEPIRGRGGRGKMVLEEGWRGGWGRAGGSLRWSVEAARAAFFYLRFEIRDFRFCGCGASRQVRIRKVNSGRKLLCWSWRCLPGWRDALCLRARVENFRASEPVRGRGRPRHPDVIG